MENLHQKHPSKYVKFGHICLNLDVKIVHIWYILGAEIELREDKIDVF